MSLIRRLTVLQNEAANSPVPPRKYFHMGQPEEMDDVGECLPMVALVDENLSRFVLSDAASLRWGLGDVLLRSLPNIEVKSGEGVFLLTAAGEDRSDEHPAGKGRMHFVHLGLERPLATRGITKLYLYRLDGVQVHGLKPRLDRG
jgi:hypothetical protein